MMSPLRLILAGALVPAIGIIATGWLVLGFLRLRLRSFERWPAAIATGLPIFSTLLLLLYQLRRFRISNILILVLILTVAALWRRRSLACEDAPPPIPNRWHLLAGLLLATASAWWPVRSALRPDATPPGEDQALAAAFAVFRRVAAPAFDATSTYSAAFLFGHHSAVALFHCLALPALALVVFAAVRRFFEPLPSLLTALLVFTAPALGYFGGHAGSQLLLLFATSAALWLTAVALHGRQLSLLGPAALLAVFSALLLPAPGAAFGGFLFDRLPWQITPLAIFVLGLLLHRQPLCLGALVVFQIVTARPPLAVKLTPPDRPILTFQYREPPFAGLAAMIESETPPNSAVLSQRPLPLAWISRRASTDPTLLRFAAVASDPDLRPAHQLRFPVAPARRQKFYLERTGLVSEVRFYLHGNEVLRHTGWRARSLEGEPLAGALFDNSLVTACDCAAEIEFSAPTTFDEVVLTGQRGTPFRTPKGLRRAAVLEWKRRGLTHLLVWEGTPLYSELAQFAPYWGLRLKGSLDDAHLFAID